MMNFNTQNEGIVTKDDRFYSSRSQHENRKIGRKMLQEKLEVLALGSESKVMSV